MLNKVLFALIASACIWLCCEAVREDGQVGEYLLTNLTNLCTFIEFQKFLKSSYLCNF